jgi:hypothetical protein
LHIAAKKGDLETARKLLEHGVDPNISDFAGTIKKLKLNILEIHRVFFRLDPIT